MRCRGVRIAHVADEHLRSSDPRVGEVFGGDVSDRGGQQFVEQSFLADGTGVRAQLGGSRWLA